MLNIRYSPEHAYWWYAKGVADSNPVFDIKPERFQMFVEAFIKHDCRFTSSLAVTTIEQLFHKWIRTQSLKVKNS